MSGLIAFEICKTEKINVDGKNFIAHLLRRKDHELYELLVVDEQDKVSWRCSFEDEAAKDFMTQTGEKLAGHVAKIMKGDLKSGVPHVE
ncbi:hypothetical protein KWH04_24035 [Xanthomonas campestris pv. trichodesmae]|uniref:Uncharacterized protein n=2 Tax=Xanthomonas citri TaxID=346 RepID=A0AB33CH95_XANCI|nr:hypothetical protein [Xanthomonas citri]ASK93284.1 hypothetical protein XcvCFBP7111P_18850 [Xanthomonas citri pv. vignicola]MBV6783612.1 hypothetical protein [Xanthomonas campestris pv. trichodesmae]MBZ3918670.1 hypothetical protein [Xanthomonas campestris pv. trichodesmae]MBZ3923617.1 hypothetical protein [Xanthomonas citri pv. sesbaniae]